MAIAFELKHGIHYMLQHFGSGYATLFIDVPYQHHRGVGFLCKFQKSRRTFSYLTHAAGSRLKFVGSYGLNRVYYYEVGIILFYRSKNAVERCFAYQITLTIDVFAGYTVGAHLQLLGTFFARYVEHLAAAYAQHILQHQGRLSYSGLATYQHK